MSMAQSEIFELLKEKRIGGDDGFFSPRDISRLLKENHVCPHNHVYLQIKKLYLYGYLSMCTFPKVENKPWLGWNRKYRYRFVNEPSQVGGLHGL